MVFRETIALGQVLLSEEMRREMKDVFLLNYRDIPAANNRLRRMNGTAGEYYTSCSGKYNTIPRLRKGCRLISRLCRLAS